MSLGHVLGKPVAAVCGQPFLRAFVSSAGRDEFCTGAENKSSPAGDLSSVCLARLWTFGCEGREWTISGGNRGAGVYILLLPPPPGGQSPSLSRAWHPSRTEASTCSVHNISAEVSFFFSSPPLTRGGGGAAAEVPPVQCLPWDVAQHDTVSSGGLVRPGVCILCAKCLLARFTCV